MLKTNNNSILHGENFLRRIANKPKGRWSSHDLYIVGHSETGHNHVIKGKVAVMEQDQKRYLLVKEVGELFHQKSFDIHETVWVEPGIYEITHKTEYNPFTKVITRVFD